MTGLVCEEFDQFVEALSGLDGRYLLRTKQSRDWRLRMVDLNGVVLTIGHEGAGRIYNGLGLRGHFHAYLLLDGDHAVTVDGRVFRPGQICWIAPGKTFHTCTSGPICWLNISLSTELVLRCARAWEGDFDASLLDTSAIVHAVHGSPALIQLASRLIELEGRSPGRLRSPNAERVAREQVSRAVFHCLSSCRRPQVPSRAAGRRMRILDAALGLLDAMDYNAVHMDDLCQATSASERTLRNIFHEYLGMSPHRYLMIRRLYAIRTAIRHAGPGDTLTGMCARYGVWDFGRFAKCYRESFGMLPSQALRSRNL